MRLVLEVKLKNNTIMNVIANAKNKEDAKNWAVTNSIRLFADTKMHVTSDSVIISCDKWSQDKQASYQSGFKQYLVAFYLDNITQFLRIEAAGVKSAYNSVKSKFGIQENVNMMIFEINQQIKTDKKKNTSENNKSEVKKDRKSSVEYALRIVNDLNKLSYILTKANEKVKNIPILSLYNAETYLMFSLVTDYCCGRYANVSADTVVGIVSCCIYLLNPEDFLPDMSNDVANLDAVTVFAWAVKQSQDDLLTYSKWACCNDSFVGMG